MATQAWSQEYESLLKLAESGQHEQALKAFKTYLARHPEDGQAWNDSGAVLYCMGRVDEAIKHFERAKALLGENASTGEVFWNLTEAYIDGGYPKQAAAMLEALERLKILSADVVNRIANAFLKAEDYANAIEMLLYSQDLAAEQEIIPPMIKVIRSHRAKVGVIYENQRPGLADLLKYIEKRFVVHVHVDEPVYEMRQILSQVDIAWFDGFSAAFEQSAMLEKLGSIVLRLDRNDLTGRDLRKMDLSRVDVLVLPDSVDPKQLLGDLERISDTTKVVQMGEAIWTEDYVLQERGRGKRLACPGPFNAKNNPAFLIQCMQKLNYIDGDYRLYLSGEFEEAWLEDYTRSTVDAMGLAHAVIFDEPADDIGKWFADKHYVVSTCMTDEAMTNIFKAMACGLKPVMHRFPGAADLLDSAFLFGIAEDFCSQVTCGDYAPRQYRDIVEKRYSAKNVYKIMNNVLSGIERMERARRRVAEKKALPVNPAPAFAPEAVQERPAPVPVAIPQIKPVVSEPIKPLNFAPAVAAEAPAVPPSVPQNTWQDSEQVMGRRQNNVIPIKPIRPDFSEETPVSIPEAPAPEPVIPSRAAEMVTPQDKGRVSRIAAAALEASRTLMNLANKTPQPPQDWTAPSSNEAELARSGGDLEESIREQKLRKAAQEFVRGANQQAEVRRVQETQNPFLKI